MTNQFIHIQCYFAAALVRFSISGNFLGLPAVTIPVCYCLVQIQYHIYNLSQFNFDFIYLFI